MPEASLAQMPLRAKTLIAAQSMSNSYEDEPSFLKKRSKRLLRRCRGSSRQRTREEQEFGFRF
jgi:hypothetical protein